jgi:UDP-N-acetylmuramyl tripeptide synthase
MRRLPRSTLSPRQLGVLNVAKLLGWSSRSLGRGGGTAAPGLVLERFAPELVGAAARRLGHGAILITGTNGKTTTAQLLAGIAHAAGWTLVANRSGSNLMRGLAASVVEASDSIGRIPHAARALGVFEVDEATLPEAASRLEPRAIVVTNLFRDQLDRYGEVDSILSLWRKMVERLASETTLVLNADDPSVASLGTSHRGAVLYCGVDDTRLAAQTEHAADARWCAVCGAEYRYAALYYGHIGVWSCPRCGVRRPRPQILANSVGLEPSASALTVETPAGPVSLDVPLGGLYNAYNALAACAGGLALGLPLAAVRSGIARFRPAFGRQELLRIDGREVRILLGKNPAGVNQVLRLLTAGEPGLNLLLLLNDRIADGRDVSWIWDVDYELLAGRVRTAVVSGDRALDLALRLKYAGLGTELAVETDPRAALRRAVAGTPAGETLNVLPTYTAMLEVREQLARIGGRAHYWET